MENTKTLYKYWLNGDTSKEYFVLFRGEYQLIDHIKGRHGITDYSYQVI